MENKESTEGATEPAPVRVPAASAKITSLAAAEEICRKPVQAKVKMHGRTYIFPVRLLMDEESERLDRILKEHQPPLIDGDPDEQGNRKKVFNYADSDFQKHAKRAL